MNIEEIKKEMREEIKKTTVKKETKKDKLQSIRDVIEEMIKEKISIKKQIEIIKKYKIIDKIGETEYRDILIKHFNYKPKSRKKVKKEVRTIQKANSNNSAKKTAKDILNQEISLY